MLLRMDVAAFVGFASAGPLDVPMPVEDAVQFEAIFGPNAPLAWDAERGERVNFDHYNRQRPHQCAQAPAPQPETPEPLPPVGDVHRRDRLGDLIHEYHRAAA